MARPAKSTKVNAHHATKAEKAAREEAEDRLRGDTPLTIAPPDYLTDDQKRIFADVLNLLEPIGTLNNGDVYMLTHLAVSIDREAQIDRMINDHPDWIADKDLASAREKYDKQFLRCCTELCLSPAARAKISAAAAAVKNDAKDPLMSALGGDSQ